MAKALIGHLHSDGRSTTALTVENRRLRARVADLEALVLRLQSENDRLAAAVRHESRRDVEDLQPA
jgi:cell division protein FtsB